MYGINQLGIQVQIIQIGHVTVNQITPSAFVGGTRSAMGRARKAKPVRR
jgi:hypothetical protein